MLLDLAGVLRRRQCDERILERRSVTTEAPDGHPTSESTFERASNGSAIGGGAGDGEGPACATPRRGGPTANATAIAATANEKQRSSERSYAPIRATGAAIIPPRKSQSEEALRSRRANLVGPMRRELVTLHGRVQGVGFRERVSRSRAVHAVSGTVRNVTDGRALEINVEGEAPQSTRSVAALVARRPYFARVDQLERRPLAPRGSSASLARLRCGAQMPAYHS